jgi:hypothetical protein
MAAVEHCLFCFEALAASLEKRSPMSLYQVQQSWAAYPKGLDEEDEEDQQEESADSSPPSDNESGKPSSKLSVPRNPLLERLSGSSSGSSTPASSSSSSLSPSTNNTTPASSSTSFVPIGMRIPFPFLSADSQAASTQHLTPPLQQTPANLQPRSPSPPHLPALHNHNRIPPLRNLEHHLPVPRTLPPRLHRHLRATSPLLGPQFLRPNIRLLGPPVLAHFPLRTPLPRSLHHPPHGFRDRERCAGLGAGGSWDQD